MEERSSSTGGPTVSDKTITKLLGDLKDWLDDFSQWEAKTEVAQRTDGGAEDARTMWDANFSCHIHAVYTNVERLMSCHSTVEIIQSLNKVIYRLADCQLRDRGVVYESCEDRVSMGDIDGFYDWMLTPLGNETRGFAWVISKLQAAGRLLGRDVEAMLTRVSDGQPTKETGKRNAGKCTGREERIRNAEATNKAAADELRVKVILNELSVGASAEKMEELSKASSGIVKGAIKNLGLLAIGQQTSFSYGPVVPKLLGVGAGSVPEQFARDFRIEGWVLVEKVPQHRRLRRDQPGEGTISFDEGAFEIFRAEIALAFLNNLGWKVT